MEMINRQQVIDLVMQYCPDDDGSVLRDVDIRELLDDIENLPSAQPEYEPVKAEDFAKTMSENTLYGFIAWHSRALELMERQGFVICKKTM